MLVPNIIEEFLVALRSAENLKSNGDPVPTLENDENLSAFFEVCDNFRELIVEGVNISESRLGVFHTGRQNLSLSVYANLLYLSLPVMDITENFRENKVRLNHCAIMTLVRSISDAALMCLYISDPNISEVEWQLRRKIFFLHEISNRRRFLGDFRKFQKDLEKTTPRVLTDVEVEGANYRRRLIKEIEGLILQIPLQLDEEAKTKILNGSAVFVSGVRSAVRECGFNQTYFDAMSSYLSNWVHSHPVSFIRDDEIGKSVHNSSHYEIDTATVAIFYANSWLNFANERMNNFTGNERNDHLWKGELQ